MPHLQITDEAFVALRGEALRRVAQRGDVLRRDAQEDCFYD